MLCPVTDSAPTSQYVDDLALDAAAPDAVGPDAAATDSVEVAATTGSSADAGLEVAMATIEDAEGVLGDVEAALERLEAGQYLTCEICGAPLEVAILVGTPTLRRCVVHAG
jgi:RNA polymerase-binding transcription factor DksA